MPKMLISSFKSIASTILISSCLSLTLSGCGKPTVDPTIPNQLQDLRQMRKSRLNKQEKVSKMREQILRDTALSLGAQAGMAWRAQQLNALVSIYKTPLSRVFNFYPLLLEKAVLPPILREGRDSFALANDLIIRVNDRDYQIIEQARFVTVPPTWQDYLYANYTMDQRNLHLLRKKPGEKIEYANLVSKGLLPRNKVERIIWITNINKGWNAGIQQAENILLQGINKMQRDYMGMILYRNLLAKKMVSAPFVATQELGITGNDNELNINDRILMITSLPSLQTNSNAWKTELISTE